MVTESTRRRSVIVAASTLGVGLSGFFDGILLHQVLQWHHLLSLVPGETFRDIRVQILADGLFHVLMYIVTAVGLFLLWRRRPDRSASHAGWREVGGGGLLGFGLWNVIDVGLFHWILGIHRIRINVPDPMLYDVGWLVGLGLLPLVAAWLLLRGSDPGGTRRTPVPASLLTLLALGAAPLAALPQPDSNSALVVFAPRATAATAVNAAAAAGADILWMDPEGTMMAVRLPDGGTAGRLYRAGALFVTRTPALAGCAASTTIA